jgi:3'-phosphoadenosine 5'-phosphosulfate sulfotransferase (PAPS reductase)/FAD synthetase
MTLATRTQVASIGGGVNSWAMLTLACEGKLPRPDIVIMADTGRECSAAWNYLSDFGAPYLKRYGLEITIAPHSLATVDLYAHNDDLLLPMFTKYGKLPGFCSNEWKARPVNRQLRKMGVKECDIWIGYSLSEVERVKPSSLKWQTRRFPLLENGGLTRQDCKTIIERAGLPLPDKSACWMCPHRNNAEWRNLRDNYPSDWENAIELEALVRVQDNQIWLHRSTVTLDKADISKDNKQESVPCGMGMCFV